MTTALSFKLYVSISKEYSIGSKFEFLTDIEIGNVSFAIFS